MISSTTNSFGTTGVTISATKGGGGGEPSGGTDVALADAGTINSVNALLLSIVITAANTGMAQRKREIDSYHDATAALCRKIMHDVDDAISDLRAAAEESDWVKFTQWVLAAATLVAGIATLAVGVVLLCQGNPAGVMMLMMGAYTTTEGALMMARASGKKEPELGIDSPLELGMNKMLKRWGVSDDEAHFWAPIIGALAVGMLCGGLSETAILISALVVTPKLTTEAADHVAAKAGADKKTLEAIDMTMQVLAQVARTVAMMAAGGLAGSVATLSRTAQLLVDVAEAVATTSQMVGGLAQISEGGLELAIAEATFRAALARNRMQQSQGVMSMFDELLKRAIDQIKRNQNAIDGAMDAYTAALHAQDRALYQAAIVTA